MKFTLAELTHSQYSIHTLDWIFEKPTFNSTDFFRRANIPEPTAKRILGILKKEKVVKELIPGSGRRPAIYCFPALLNVAEGYEAF